MRFIFRKDLNPVTKGFTLVELLIVVSILGILAAFTMSIINTRTQRSRAEDAVRQATVQKLAPRLLDVLESGLAGDDRSLGGVDVVPVLVAFEHLS